MLLFSPLSEEAKKQFHEIDKRHKWLLALNLKEMEEDFEEADRANINKPTKSSWLRPKPLSEKPKVAQAREKFYSPENEEKLRPLFSLITNFENSVAKTNKSYFQMYSLIFLLFDYRKILSKAGKEISDPSVVKIAKTYIAAQLKTLFYSAIAVVNLILSAIAIIAVIAAVIAGFSHLNCSGNQDNQSGRGPQPLPPVSGPITIKPSPPQPNQPPSGTPPVTTPTTTEVMKTGEFNLVMAGQFNFIGESKGRMISTTVHGKVLYSDDHFQTEALELAHPNITAPLYIDNSGNIYLISVNTIYKSTDRGDNWEKIYTHPKCSILSILIPGLTGYDAITTISSGCNHVPTSGTYKDLEMINFKTGEKRFIFCDQGISNLLRKNDEIFAASDGFSGILRIDLGSEKCIADSDGLPRKTTMDLIQPTFDLAVFQGALVVGGKNITYKTGGEKYRTLINLQSELWGMKIATDPTDNYLAIGVNKPEIYAHPFVYLFKSLQSPPYLFLSLPKAGETDSLIFSGEYLYLASGVGLYRAKYK